MERREFMGFAVTTAALGATEQRTIDQFAVLPLEEPPVREIEWLNGLDLDAEVYVRLGRYRGPLTEELLLEAVLTCGMEKPRTITLSTMGCRDYVKQSKARRRYVAEPSLGYREDSIVLMAPGKSIQIEVSFGLPNGFLTVG